MKPNKHYIWQSVKGTTRIDIHETNKNIKPTIADILKRRRRIQMIECVVGLIGILIGMGFGIWVTIQIFLFPRH